MRAALDSVDVVGVTEHAFMHRVGPLQRAIDVDSVTYGLEVDHVVQRLAALVKDLDELADAAFEMELLVLAGALVGQPDPQPAVEVGHLAQIARDNFVFEFDFGKNLRVGRKSGLGPGFFGDALLLDLGLGNAALVALIVDLAVAMDLGFEFLTERVYYRRAHAVQTTRHLVRAAVELAAGMEDGVHYLQRRALFGG